jgi:hypothetical protein
MHKRSILRLSLLALVAHGAAARAANPPEPVKDWTQGVLVAVNELFGARSGGAGSIHPSRSAASSARSSPCRRSRRW